MTITMYHNPACGTSRRVLELIRERGHDPHVIEYLKAPLDREQLAALIRRMKVTARDILRAKGDLYMELKLDDPERKDGEILDAMAQHPVLMNRPIVVTPKGAKLCRPAETVLTILPEK